MLANIMDAKLTEENFEVQHAYDGEEAYRILANGTLPDLVLLDVLLPKISGFDVLEKLRSEGKKLPKIIVFSNFAQEEDMRWAYQLGAIDYIVKSSFSPAQIIARIKKVFEENEQGPAGAAQPEAAAAASPYHQFDSMKDVMPMAEVLHPGDATPHS